MNPFLESPQNNSDNISFLNFGRVLQPDRVNQVQETHSYYQDSNQNGVFLGNSSKIFPSLAQITNQKCRMSSASLFTRESTGSGQTLSKKQSSQASLFGNGRSEDNGDFNDPPISHSPVDTESLGFPSGSSPASANLGFLQMREEFSGTISSHVENLSPESKQNPARNLPGLVVGRAKKDCKMYFNFKNNSKKNKQNLPEYLYYVRDIIEDSEFARYTEGRLEEHLDKIRIKDNTYKGVSKVFQSTSPACQKLMLRVTQSLLSDNGTVSFGKWVDETKKMGKDTKTALREKKMELLENFNGKFVERYEF